MKYHKHYLFKNSKFLSDFKFLWVSSQFKKVGVASNHFSDAPVFIDPVSRSPRLGLKFLVSQLTKMVHFAKNEGILIF